MKFKKQLLNAEQQGRKCPFSMKPEYITIHEINTNQSAETVARYVTLSFGMIAAHFFVDEEEIIQVITCDHNAFACGDGLEGTGNRKSISIEICRSKAKKDEYYYRSVENARVLTKYLMKKYGIPLDRVLRHYDWTKKDCPHRMMKENLWQTFKCKLQKGEIQDEEFSL